jgi:peptide/nickel transport system substrate-binding protein
MAIRKALLVAALGAAALLGACKDKAEGLVAVSAIGSPPELRNPNLQPLDPPSAMLVHAAAQGLVRFDAAGQIEPALAQSWIVSNDGLRYTFRIARTNWPDGRPVTAEQVVARLRATTAGASKNPLKPLLGVIETIEAMTENVLEVSLKAPRPNFLQLLAQPELGIIRKEQGTGPYVAERQPAGAILLRLPKEEGEEEPDGSSGELVLRGEHAALAIARFRRGMADLVSGGTVGDLAIARAAALPAAALRFDPVAGLFGLEAVRASGPAGDPEIRQALSMAIDRGTLVTALAVPGLQARETLIPAGIEELPAPALPGWAADPLPARRDRAADAVRGAGNAAARPIRVLVPSGPGYRLVFAHLRRDWRAIGIDAEAVQRESEADLRFVDAVAPATLASWYLRRFVCGASAICSPEADAALAAARVARAPAERQALLATADRVVTDLTAFIPIAAPVRWSLVSPRLTGFQPNSFGRHFIGGLVEEPR